MKLREGKATDQEKTQEAYKLLLDLIKAHQDDIEPALWIGAMMCALAENFEQSGIPFTSFKEEISACLNHYRY